ncbi:MAG TPA: 5-dehydro-2-deoxygluconokinase [Caulobacteraceae bacterium]|nr:5-dehydro-2-deoxygluconokinase [Caulobacteraceae bacterium]
MSARLDLIAIGRALVDLYGEQVGGRLEDMGSFAKYVGGSPTNTAIGAARLGLSAGLITRVGGDHFGRFIAEELAREGVDVSGVTSDPARLTGLALLGIRDAERFPLVFYRRDCADMALSEADIDPALIARADAVVLSGTHLSTEAVSKASLKAARLAKVASGKVAFDIDYRPVLWGVAPQDAGETRFVADAAVTARLSGAAALADLIVGTEEEFQILGGADEPIAALQAVRRQTDALLVCKRGPLGAVAFPGAVGADFDSGIARAGVTIEVFNVLGAGDAFMAGFLRGWLRDEPLETALDWANACGALVVSRHGCAPAMPSWTELMAFLNDGPWPTRLRDDARLAHLHWATTRKPDWPELFVRTLDGGPAPDGGAGVGVLAEGEADLLALYAAADRRLWLGRRLDDRADLRDWPLTHVAVVYAAGQGSAALIEIAAACRATRHELMLETTDGAATMARVYALGVRPDWWAVDADADWPAVSATLAAADPHCRGVLVVGGGSGAVAAAREPCVRGFIGPAAGFAERIEAWRTTKAAAMAEPVA